MYAFNVRPFLKNLTFLSWINVIKGLWKYILIFVQSAKNSNNTKHYNTIRISLLLHFWLSSLLYLFQITRKVEYRKKPKWIVHKEMSVQKLLDIVSVFQDTYFFHSTWSWFGSKVEQAWLLISCSSSYP